MIILVPHKLKNIQNLMIISILNFAIFSISYLISIAILTQTNLVGSEILYWLIPIFSFLIGNVNLLFVIISSLVIKNKGLINKNQLKILFYISCTMIPCLLFGTVQGFFGINLYLKAYKNINSEGVNDNKKMVDDYYMTSFTRFNLLVTTISFIVVDIIIFTFLIIYNVLNNALGKLDFNIVSIIVISSFGLIFHLFALFASAKLFLTKTPITNKTYKQNYISLFLILIIFVSVPIFNIFIFWHFMLMFHKNNDFNSEYSIDGINPLDEYEKWELATTSYNTGSGYIQYFRGSFADDYDEDGRLILYKEEGDSQNNNNFKNKESK